jgi:hypothetical protein
MPGTPFRPYFRVPPRTNRWVPTVSVGVTLVPIDPGQVTWTGQDVPAAITVPISAGALTWTGSSITPNIGVPVEVGQATWTGQALTATVSVAISEGLITWTGQEITAELPWIPETNADETFRVLVGARW